jgi:undecaprenyl diphosphate synthase/tritrans,polycis-undecaprenyl-diphosphate synthase [geranylgeranyl-diphosphate specific]
MTDDVKTRKNGIHIGLIPDGNRRYALEHGKSLIIGHKEGAKRIEEFLDWCNEYPEIKMVSVFALSTENLNRPKEEVQALWDIYKTQLRRLLQSQEVKKNRIKIRVLGNDGVWKPDIKDIVKELFESTKSYSRYVLNILLAYGSKFEINQAVKETIKRPLTKLDKALYVKEPLDLVIRTGRQHRLSNFMLYQSSYAEIYFSDSLWPEFTREEFDRVMEWYFEQQRKFGK